MGTRGPSSGAGWSFSYTTCLCPWGPVCPVPSLHHTLSPHSAWCCRQHSLREHQCRLVTAQRAGGRFLGQTQDHCGLTTLAQCRNRAGPRARHLGRSVGSSPATLHATSPAATAFSRPPPSPGRARGHRDCPLTSGRCPPPHPPFFFSLRRGTLVGICTFKACPRPWACLGGFQWQMFGETRGSAGSLGWPAQGQVQRKGTRGN